MRLTMTAILRAALLAVFVAASIPAPAAGQDTSTASLLRRIELLERANTDLDQRVRELEAVIKGGSTLSRDSEAVIAPIGGEVFLVDVVQEKPSVVSASPLVYPTLLRQAGIEGRVIIEAVIDTAGRAEPISIKVMSTANPGFNLSAKSYVLHALFRPARIYGRAVRVRVQIPIDFNIYAQ